MFKNIDIADKIGKLVLAFMLALISSWFPFLVWDISTSVLTFLPKANWEQVTFFTWFGITLLLWRL